MIYVPKRGGSKMLYRLARLFLVGLYIFLGVALTLVALGLMPAWHYDTGGLWPLLKHPWYAFGALCWFTAAATCSRRN